MPTIIETKAFAFDELSDAAKAKARDWYRETSSNDASDFDFSTDDFVAVLEIMGVEVSTHEVKLMSGKTRRAPNIYWSGFCSQGDGASFSGDYHYNAAAPAKIRAHAPQDNELHRIADELSALQLRNAFGLCARITQSGHYYHSNTMDVEVHDARNEDRAITGGDDYELRQLMRDLADWHYKQLDAENDDRQSDECVDENIEANEYMFDEEGDRHAYA